MINKNNKIAEKLNNHFCKIAETENKIPKGNNKFPDYLKLVSAIFLKL